MHKLIKMAAHSYYGLLVLGVLCSLNVCCNCDSCGIDPSFRVDCYPETATQEEEKCSNRGCCFNPFSGVGYDNVPWCYYPTDYQSYQLKNYKQTSYGFNGILILPSTAHTRIEKQISTLVFDAFIETPERIRFQIRDASMERYEVPIETPKIINATLDPLMYSLTVKSNPFDLVIKRKSTENVIFDTSIGPLIYANQFLQLSSVLPSKYLYGLGERYESSLVETSWKRLLFWARGQDPQVDTNLYGAHPFYMGIEDDGNAFGVFLLNSNAMEAEVQPAPAITWRTIGGILDFYILLGPNPEAVVQQYTQVVGRPFMPPYWSLGFHLCRWGYDSSQATQDIVNRMRTAKMPQDVQWNDIDYMDNKRDFTYDKTNYNTLSQVVKNIHDNGQHYMMIIDPGISNQQQPGSYPPYDDGVAMDIFIKDPSGSSPIEGNVWPGNTVFPDFTHRDASAYWQKQLQSYHDEVPFDGVWIDMNEPSNFVDGSTSGCPGNSSLEEPPYVPPVQGNNLTTKTLCMSAVQNLSAHYNVHNLFGTLEMKATSEALVNIRGQRPFVISRSTFPSAGKYGGHWSGDVTSTWQALKQSISSVINFNLFGIPMIGADICGFNTPTNEQLCIRWMQLGAFYPFSRNHNSHLIRAQAPVDFSITAQNYMRDALNMRYILLPYLYTLFYAANANGTTVARGLFSEFPNDKNALLINEQFMWGRGLLISPVVQENKDVVNAYFPNGIWYELMNLGDIVEVDGKWVEIEAPLDKILVHFRGGNIIPGQYPALNTDASRSNPFILFVAPDRTGSALGTLYWDDGVSLEPVSNFFQADFRYTQNTLVSYVNHSYMEPLKLGTIYFFNVVSIPSFITLNGVSLAFDTMPNYVLKVDLSVDLNKSFQLNITP